MSIDHDGSLIIGRHYTQYSPITEIVGEGENRDVKPIIRNSLIRTDEFINRLNANVNRIHGLRNSEKINILPPNTRISYKSPVNGYEVFVIEEAPCVRTIGVDIGFDESIEALKKTGKYDLYDVGEARKNKHHSERRAIQFNLAFPYIVFVITAYGPETRPSYGSVRVFYRTAPIRSLSDPLYLVNLTNVNGTGICLGSNPESTTINSYTSLVNSVIQRFWVNVFNTDYIGNYLDYSKRVPELSDFFTWQYNTKIDPTFVFGVDWKPSGKTLGQTLKEATGESNQRSYQRHGMIDVSTLIASMKVKLDTEDVDGDTSRTSSAIIVDNLTDQFYLGENITLSVGDSLYYNDKLYFVNTFQGVDGEYPIKVTLEPEDSEDQKDIISLDLRNKVIISLLLKGVQKVRKETEVKLPDGTSFKSGDLIKIESKYYGTIYRKVDTLRVARDGNVEIKIENNWYLVGEANKLEKIDKLVFGGVELRPGNSYKILNQLNNHIFNGAIIQTGKFIEPEISRYGETMTAKFEMQNRGTRNIKLSENPPFASEKDIPVITPLVRANSFIHTNTKNVPYQIGVLNGTSLTCVVNENHTMDSYRDTVITYDMAFAFKELSKVKDRLFIPSWDFDVDLSIGDFVILPDWTNPVEFKKVRQITGFEMKDGTFFVNTRYQNQDVAYPMINFTTGRIDTVGIRKVAHEIDGISIGDFVKGAVPHIPYFPKKDTFKVVAIVTDTGNAPLILCSNLCTIWYDSEAKENFNFISKTSPEASKLSDDGDAFNLAAIRIQTGDMALIIENTNNTKHLGYYNVERDYLEAFYEDNPRNIRTHNSSRTIRYGVQLPRHKVKDIEQARNLNSTVGHHGKCAFKEYSPISVPSLKGVFNDV